MTKQLQSTQGDLLEAWEVTGKIKEELAQAKKLNEYLAQIVAKAEQAMLAKD